MARHGKRPVEIECTLVRQSELAWLVNDGDRSVWIPKRVGELEGAGGATFVLTISEDLAYEKGLI